MKRQRKRLSAIILTMVMILSIIPFGVLAKSDKNGELRAGIISDIHYYPQSLIGDAENEDFQNMASSQGKQFVQSEGLVDSALAALTEHAKENGLKYVFIPGDLSKDGEYEAHASVAKKLEQFEKESGVSVFVVNGNHDINNYNACSFASGEKAPARITTPEEFREIYKNLGFDNAYHKYTPKNGKSGMLSYSARLDGGYRLIAIDTAKYSEDATESGKNRNETAGAISPDLTEWILDEIKDAKKKGETPICMTHHSLVPHMELEATILQPFVLDDYMQVIEAFADAGMHYGITGHFHVSDCALHVNDNGEPFYDISTAALGGFPNTFREVTFTTDNDKVSADIQTFDVDCVKNVVVNGKEIPKPYTEYSFAYTYRGGDALSYFNNLADSLITSVFTDIQKAGGLEAYIKLKGVDLEEVFDGLLNGGITVAGIPLFTSQNLMSFLSDLFKQIDENYINDIDGTLKKLNPIVEKLVNHKMSDVPCTKFYDKYGVGDASRPGNLGDLVLSIMAYYLAGDEDISDDAFMKDVLYQMENGDTAERTLNLLIDVLMHDLIQDEILKTLDLNINKLFPQGQLGHITGETLQLVLEVIMCGDNSYMNIIDFVFALGVLPYENIDAILNHFMDEYLTDSQYESIGHTLAVNVDDFCIDENPGIKMDNNVTLVYDGKMPVEATSDNYRKPSTVTVTLGDDASAERNISWYTKYSVDGTDIEIIPYSDNPTFTGKPTKHIKSETEKAKLQYPGVDFGMFGIMKYEFDAVRHKIYLTDLEPGKKYCFRVGDAKRGWWSDVGVIETADNSDKVTFLHMTDMQSQNEKQYETFANTARQAFKLFPDTKFIVSTGDQVDSGSNSNQWKWLFNTASDTMMKTAFMPTAGNHEKSFDYSLDRNFIFPTSPEQDASTGRYYSFDYNNVHVMILNTNNLTKDGALSEDQVNWLRQDASKSDAQWKIVAFHKAVYSNGSHFDDSDVIELREQLGKLMPELGIDVVLQGHDHVYLRTDAMDSNKVVPSETKTVTYQGREYKMKLDPKGSVYVISACAGVKKYTAKPNEETDKLFPRAESIVNADAPVFSAFTIDGSSLYMDAYRVIGDKTERIDSFALSKAPDSEDMTKPEDTTTDEGTTAPVVTAPEESTIPDDTDKTTITSEVSLNETTKREPIVNTGDSTRILAVLLPMAVCAGVAVTVKKKRK